VSDDLWIVIPSWERFQHYKDRDPNWIKNYTALLNDPDYLTLTAHQRGVLHGLWLIYASSHCRVRANTASLSRQLGVRVSSRQLTSLNHAGFIQLSASKPLALARSREDSFQESKSAGARSERQSARPPAPEEKTQRQPEPEREPEPERSPDHDQEALALIDALHAKMGWRQP
jgi:hypothetical protein